MDRYHTTNKRKKTKFEIKHLDKLYQHLSKRKIHRIEACEGPNGMKTFRTSPWEEGTANNRWCRCTYPHGPAQSICVVQGGTVPPWWYSHMKRGKDGTATIHHMKCPPAPKVFAPGAGHAVRLVLKTH